MTLLLFVRRHNPVSPGLYLLAYISWKAYCRAAALRVSREHAEAMLNPELHIIASAYSALYPPLLEAR